MAEYIELEKLMAFPIRIDHYDKEHGNVHFVLGIECVLEYAQDLPIENYMMEHSKKEDGGTIYAIRYPVATRGNIITDPKGTIVQIILDETFYGKGAYAAVAKYIGYRMDFDGVKV